MAFEGVNRLFGRVGAVVMRRGKLEFVFVSVNDDFLEARRTFVIHNMMVWAESTCTQVLKNFSVNPDGIKYLGFTLQWDYVRKKVWLLMPEYVRKALHRLQHEMPRRPQHAPHRYNKPNYGQRVQFANPQDDMPVTLLPESAKKTIQKIIGIFLYYAIAMDLTMLVALGTLASQQENPTDALWEDITLFLDYCATHPDAKICYSKSDMVLHISSDGSYLSEKKSRSRVGGVFYLSDLPAKGQAPDVSHPFNAPIHVVAKILKMITSSAMETEIAATFYNCKEGLPFRVALEKMDHPQPPTPVEVDNEAAIGFLLDTMKMKHSKAIDMRFYWVKDRISQQQFLIYWRPGKHNLGDYVSKHHSAAHHITMRPTFFANLILTPLLPTSTSTCLHKVFLCLQRGCDKLYISHIPL